MANDLIVTRMLMLDADITRVWDLLINPAITRHYMYDMDVQTDWKVGSPIVFTGYSNGASIGRRGVIIDYIPVKTLKYSLFDPYSGREDAPENYVHVTYTLTPIGNRTELSITLSNFNGNEMRVQLAAEEWDFNIIPRLKAYAEEHLYVKSIL